MSKSYYIKSPTPIWLSKDYYLKEFNTIVELISVKYKSKVKIRFISHGSGLYEFYEPELSIPGVDPNPVPDIILTAFKMYCLRNNLKTCSKKESKIKKE